MKPVARTTEFLSVQGIVVRDRLRSINDKTVSKISDSMALIGLRMPISVRMTSEDDGYDAVLVAGLHRLRAAELLGWDKIECFVVESEDPIDAEMWEISENLHRADLTKLQRDEQVARWIELKNSKRLSLQVATKVGKPELFGRPESGINAAARQLGIEKTEAFRAMKVASLITEAKVAATEAGLDDNRSALLEIAKAEPAKQVAVVREIADRKSSKIDADVKWDAAKQFAESLAQKYDAAEWDFVKASLYSAGAKILGDAFCNVIGAGSPIMDRRFA